MVVRGTSGDGTRDGPIIIIEHYFLMLYFQSDIQKKLLKNLKTAPLASPARATDGQMVPH